MTKKHPLLPDSSTLPSPVEKAIKQLMEEVLKRGSASIDGVIVHPRDLPTLGALIENKPLPKVTGGPLTRAYENSLRDANQRVLMGQQVAGVSFDEAGKTSVSALEQQLADSLWALADGLTEQATPEVIAKHVPHMEGSTERIRRVYTNSVMLLCPCKTKLVFRRCVAMDSYQTSATRPPERVRCEEEVPVVEAGYANCVLHR